MTQEDQQLIEQMITEAISSHVHGVNSPKVWGKYLRDAPQTALTGVDNTSFSTAGVTKLDDSNITILNNMRTRIGEVENILTNLNLTQ